MRSALILLLLLLSGASRAQWVYPRDSYHDHDPKVYKEDPFIVKYRKEFFSVFTGDVERFNKAYAEIQAMVQKDPKDARALVWLGNGQTVKAGLLAMKGKLAEGKPLLAESRKTLDRAVKLKPGDPNIYMMRAVTLFIQGQYWSSEMPRRAWETLRDDCLRFIAFLGPKMPKMSLHVRGETYGELGVAYKRLGEDAKAIKAFEKVKEIAPDSDYSKKADEEISKLKSSLF